MINEYPIFVISYNRAKNHTTAKWLAKYCVKHFMIVHKEQLDDPTKRKPDITLAKTILKWEPTIKLSEGLDKTILYFKKRVVLTKQLESNNTREIK